MYTLGTSYLKAHPFGNCYPKPFLPKTTMQTHALEDPSASLSTCVGKAEIEGQRFTEAYRKHLNKNY